MPTSLKGSCAGAACWTDPPRDYWIGGTAESGAEFFWGIITHGNSAGTPSNVTWATSACTLVHDGLYDYSYAYKHNSPPTGAEYFFGNANTGDNTYAGVGVFLAGVDENAPIVQYKTGSQLSSTPYLTLDNPSRLGSFLLLTLKSGGYNHSIAGYDGSTYITKGTADGDQCDPPQPNLTFGCVYKVSTGGITTVQASCSYATWYMTLYEIGGYPPKGQSIWWT